MSAHDAATQIFRRVVGISLLNYETVAEFLNAIINIMREESDYNHFAIGTVVEDRTLIFRAGYGIAINDDSPLSVRPGQGIAGWVLEQGEPLLVPDTKIESRYRNVLAETRSELCVPLKTRKKVIGVINAESTRLGRFTQDDLELFIMVANVISGPLERLLLQEQAVAQEQQKLALLTPRESQVLREIVQGKSNKEIARDLQIKENTVEAHLKRIFLKIGVRSRIEAALWARGQSIFD